MSLRRSGTDPGWVKPLFVSLSLKLLLWLFGIILVAFAVYAFFSIRTTSAQWNGTVLDGAEQFADLIRRSTHRGMLGNRKEEVHGIIATIAGEPGVLGVRIYDKRGTVIFSGDQSEIGRRVDLQAEACTACHDPNGPLRAVPDTGRVRVYGSPRGRVLGLISPIRNAAECARAACHAHPAALTVLGVLDVKMSLAGADARLATARAQIIVAAVFTALAGGGASALFILLMVRRPVKRLMEGTRRVAGGDLSAEIPEQGRDEIGQLAQSFNRMTADLRQAREELTAWSDRLEERLREKTRELTAAQRQVVHTEKMASLGKLSATVAHEINNPLAGILNYARLSERTMRENDPSAEDRAEIGRYLSLIQQEAARCGTIVRNLLVFARRTAAAFAPQPLTPILDRALMLIRHHAEISGVALQVESADGDDTLVCDADQIEQALVALLMNAVEAMPGGGTLRIRVAGDPDAMTITISDTGVGIAPDVQAHLFEPFFSTKAESYGVGLGLAVVYGIVQQHQGRVDVESEVNRGTTFRVVLPRRQAAGDAAPAARGVTGV